MMYQLSPGERSEMLRSHVGIVTALIDGDERLRANQIRAITRDQVEKSKGSLPLAAARMAKQVEAGAIVTYTLLRSLAPRLGMSDAEAHELLAVTIANLSEEQFGA